MLVEPSGALNVGSVARVCANFGVSDLRLVAPRCDHLGEEARRMAVHAAGLLEGAALFTSLTEALADCGRVVATTGRCSGEPLPLQTLDAALRWLRQPPRGEPQDRPAAPTSRALVFGREDRGLSNAELLQAGRLLSLDTAAAYASLNLAQAAAVVLHHWHGLRDDQPPPAAAQPQADPCARGVLEALLGDAEQLLLAVGFLHPHTAAARMAKLRALLQRAQVSTAEAALLRGMVRQLRWASTRGRTGTSVGDDPERTP
ncbi:RNA methyltransferase [Cyanobium sp. CH-040]|nr:RNA methyltransferase [Cyanobium sp. CH-040]